MPVSPTYPGVYIEEVPSGVRTISGVATSITAFIGAAPRGPVNEPTLINNFGNYERRFGGLDIGSTMSYAVKDFYLNGGSQALIIRIENGASPSTITLPAGVGSLVLEASSPGTWGKKLRVTVDYKTRDADEPSPNTKLFNLTVIEDAPEEEGGSTTESFVNVSIDPNDPLYVTRVLEQRSALARVSKSATFPSVRPDETVVATASPLSPLSPPSGPPKPGVKAQGGADSAALLANDYKGSRNAKTGFYALEKADLFNLLCIPPPARDGNTDKSVYQEAMVYCKERRAVLIVDSNVEWGDSSDPIAAAVAGVPTLGLGGTAARNAAIYFPRVREGDPLRKGQLDTFVPCGIVAGVIARTDADRGVWKAPAGLDAAMNGADGLQFTLTDAENGTLNPLGINCLRSFPVSGRVVWGARTMRGANQLADEYMYLSVRRTALYIEESLYRGTQWVVFEGNDEPLWAQIRLNVGAFMQTLFRQGAFQGKSPSEAYLVKCDKETTTQTDIDSGRVNILVGFAPLKPAEFVVIRIQQLAGQTRT